MSLDFYIEEMRRVAVGDFNITHNLTRMAMEAGIYEALWRPEEAVPAYTHARHIIPVLRKGLDDLRARPDHYKQFNPENGWGNYDGFVREVTQILIACEQFPNGTIRASR